MTARGNKPPSYPKPRVSPPGQMNGSGSFDATRDVLEGERKKVYDKAYQDAKWQAIDEAAKALGMTGKQLCEAAGMHPIAKTIIHDSDWDNEGVNKPENPPEGTVRWMNDLGMLAFYRGGQWLTLTPEAFMWMQRTLHNELSRAEAIEHDRLKDDTWGLALVPNKTAGYRDAAMQVREETKPNRVKRGWREFLFNDKVLIGTSIVAAMLAASGYSAALVAFSIYALLRANWKWREERRQLEASFHGQDCMCARCQLQMTCPTCQAKPGEPCDAGLHS